MCGEQWGQAVRVAVLPGSPPRVRGTDVQGDEQQDIDGITPACAGNSLQNNLR